MKGTGDKLLFFTNIMESARPGQLSRAFLARAARREFIAFLVLTLVAHALFVSLTHQHTQPRHDFARDYPVVSQDRHTPEEHLPPSDGEHCVACHLQRTLASQEHAPVFTLDLAPRDAGWESLLFDLRLTGALLTAAGRAPPLV